MEATLMNNELCKLMFSFIFYFIAITIVIISFTKKDTFKFINVTSIFKSYIEFVQNKKIVGLFFIAPISIAIGTSIQISLDYEFVNTIIVFLSILIAMFFGFITYFADYSIDDHLSLQADIQEKEAIKTTIEETKMLSSYEIIITFITIIICMIHIVFYTTDFQMAVNVVAGFIYFFVLHICLNLFIILKRFSIIFGIEKNNS